jgi:putative endonuclease
LILRDRDGTVVFVEVRSRLSADFGGAAGSIGTSKRQRLLLAARRFLQAWASPPPCRFDVVVIDKGHLQWLPAAFDLS